MDLEKAKEAVIADMQKRENEASEKISEILKEYNVNLVSTDKGISTKANL